MSYCVHCGVELAPGEKACPLCNTRVVDPGLPEGGETDLSLPDGYEEAEGPVDRRYGVKLATALLLVPTLVSILSDYFSSHAVTWSYYVCLGMICVWAFFIFPFLFSKKQPYLFVAADTAAAALTVWAIHLITGRHGWFLPLALPLVLLAGLLSGLILQQVRRRRARNLRKAGNVVLMTGAAVLCIELVISHYVEGRFRLEWSHYAAMSLAALGVILYILSFNASLSETIRRKLFL